VPTPYVPTPYVPASIAPPPPATPPQVPTSAPGTESRKAAPAGPTLPPQLAATVDQAARRLQLVDQATRNQIGRGDRRIAGHRPTLGRRPRR